MPSPKEKILFDKVHKPGEIQTVVFQIIAVDDNIATKYRVNCAANKSFEIARMERSEEFNPEMDEINKTTEEKEQRTKYWYIYDAKLNPQNRELDINEALTIIFG